MNSLALRVTRAAAFGDAVGVASGALDVATLVAGLGELETLAAGPAACEQAAMIAVAASSAAPTRTIATSILGSPNSSRFRGRRLSRIQPAPRVSTWFEKGLLEAKRRDAAEAAAERERWYAEYDAERRMRSQVPTVPPALGL